jgi:branched-chain amino acid transport system ATP-binding protein
MAFLEVRDLSKHFGGVKAVNELSFDVHNGEILGLIGPNGAGKTTVFNMISGAFAPTSGEIVYKGRQIAGLKSHKIANMRVVRTFQQTTLFPGLTVLEHMTVAGCFQSGASMLETVINTRQARLKLDAQTKENMEILRRMGLSQFQEDIPSNLPYGHQKSLGISMALASKPALLLLDEPVAGMNPEETINMMQIVQDIRSEGVTILLVEHDMKMVMGICDRLIVINFGSKLTEGKPAQIRNNPEVIKAYLGSEKID